MFKCECGKEFESSQSFNGHKSHCKVHQLYKYGSLEKLEQANQVRLVNSTEGRANAQMARNKEKLNAWIAEKHICEHCGKVMTEKFGSGRFCCRACANSRTQTAATKSKISNTIKQGFDKICSVCGKQFHTNNLSRKQCYECLPKTIKYANIKRKPTTLLELSKRTVSKIMKRIDLPCSCCGFHVSGLVLDIHHIVPKHLGGSDLLPNLTYICPNCHRIAHTDINLLPKKLVPLSDYFKEHNINWRDYYYIKDDK